MWIALVIAGAGAIVVIGAIVLRLRKPPAATLAEAAPARAASRAQSAPPSAAAIAERGAARAAHKRDIERIQTALRTRVCPRCGASPVTGEEKFKHSLSIGGGGGGSVYRLDFRCAACGAHESEMDMR